MSIISVRLSTDVGACCTSLIGGVLDDEEAEQLALLFKALGDPTRVKLVSLIAATKTGEACICDLTEPVGLTQPTIPHHMKLLAEAGLVTREQRGKWAYYRVDSNTLRAVATAIIPGHSPPHRRGDAQRTGTGVAMAPHRAGLPPC